MPDVLNQLPVDVLAENVWEPLATTSSCGSLRLASRQTRRLADLLTTSVRLRDSHWGDADEDEEDPSPLDGEKLKAWHVAAEHRAAYLARLSRLSSLELAYCPNEGTLASLLMRYGAATQGRLTRLELSGLRVLSVASTSAIRSACLQLQQLELSFGNFCGMGAALEGDPFLPLCDLPLTWLDMGGKPALSTDALRSLGGLHHLRHLGAFFDRILPHHLHSLGALVNLEHCTLGGRDKRSALTLVDAQALFALSRLTHLELPGLEHGGSAAAADSGGSGAAGADTTPELRAAIASLAGAVGLRNLIASQKFVVDDAVFSSLRHLSRLETLRVGRIELTHPQPGHLPKLQHLFVANTVRPSQLLQTLLPLLPLSSLTYLGHHFERPGMFNCPRIDIGCASDGPAAVAAQAAALKQAMACLAAAPGMRAVTQVWVSHLSGGGVGAALSCAQVVEGLSPLGGQLRRLFLQNVRAVDVQCMVLGGGLLPALQELMLHYCDMTDATLAAVGSHWTSLTSLSVCYCTGVSDEGWLRLAATRAHPLWVACCAQGAGGFPIGRLPDVLVRRCGEVQAHVFGRQNIRFG